jgi:AmmeMemoRadiSam system protein B
MRKAAVAGTFFSGDPTELRNEIRGYLENAGPERPPGELLGIVSPHAGYRYSGQAAAYGFKLVEPEKVRRVIILAPTHTYAFQGVSIAGASAYETPLGRVPMDEDACGHLVRQPHFDAIPDVHRREHSLEVQLPFLQVCLKEGFRIVPMVIGHLNRGEHRDIAETIRAVIRTGGLVLASSDFTHQGPRFGYAPYNSDVKDRIRQLDMGAIEGVLHRDSDRFLDYVQETGATICGAHPIAVLLELLPEDARGKLLAYYTSGDITGDDSESVSYASIVFFAPEGWAS